MRTITRRGRRLSRPTSIALVVLLAAACTSGSAGGGISVSGAWSRPSPMVAGAGAAYLVIENKGSSPDALIGGTSPIAAAVEIHETVDMSSAMPGSSIPAASGMGGSVMGMQKIDRLEIPAGGKVELKPGGYHVMLIDLTRELVVGEKIEITLRFEKAGEVKVSAEVRAA